jgi:Protein of unknown function (DUF4238)
MNRRQRLRRREKRAHHESVRVFDRPQLILNRASYSAVNKSHIVPQMYQEPFAINGQVAVHIDGRADCVRTSVADAGTRRRFYRRTRPNGESIDDVEASLSVVEDAATTPMGDLIKGKELTPERKGVVAQFVAVQMFRGPAFFDQRQETVVPMLESLRAGDFRPKALAAAGGNVEVARAKLIEKHLEPTPRFLTMLTKAKKVASILGCMRWHVLRFDGPILAYSDHPVVLWPMDVARSAPFERQGLGPLSAFEIRLPIAPDVAILMNWVDRSDRVGDRLDNAAAAEINAFTVAQADRQWMHQPDREPEISRGTFSPISRLVEPAYDRSTMVRSARRRAASEFIERVSDREHVDDVQVLVDVDLPAAP